MTDLTAYDGVVRLEVVHEDERVLGRRAADRPTGR